MLKQDTAFKKFPDFLLLYKYEITNTEIKLHMLK